MAKKLFIKIVGVAEYIALIIATVFVLVSQFVPQMWIVVVGMIGYVVGFLFSSIRSVFSCVEIFSASKMVAGEESALVTTNQVEVLNSKKEKVVAVLGAIMWIAVFVFALIVTIWYISKYVH